QAGRGVGKQVLRWVKADEQVRKALLLVEQHDITQIPVFRDQELVGTVYDNELLKRVLESPSVLEEKVATLMGEPLPVVAADEAVSQVTRLLASRTPAVLVRENGGINRI